MRSIVSCYKQKCKLAPFNLAHIEMVYDYKAELAGILSRSNI